MCCFSPQTSLQHFIDPFSHFQLTAPGAPAPPGCQEPRACRDSSLRWSFLGPEVEAHTAPEAGGGRSTRSWSLPDLLPLKGQGVFSPPRFSGQSAVTTEEVEVKSNQSRLVSDSAQKHCDVFTPAFAHVEADPSSHLQLCPTLSLIWVEPGPSELQSNGLTGEVGRQGNTWTVEYVFIL